MKHFFSPSPSAPLQSTSERVTWLSTLILTGAFAITSLKAADAPSPQTRVYDISQSVELTEIPNGAGKAAIWISIPDDGPSQRVLDISVVSSPGPWQIVRDKDRANRFLYVEVANPKTASLATTVQFTVERSSITKDLNPEGAIPLSEEQKAIFHEELKLDSPHMEVTEKIKGVIRDLGGENTNPVIQVGKLLDYVSTSSDHYSTNPKVPTCGLGDAESCMSKGGGCCSDLHSLFIALARGSGIPARLQMGYRLQEKNVGIDFNPGYRCWAEYFISGYGWIPTDIVEADAARDKAGSINWFRGLTERRIHLNEGRNFDLPLKQSPEPVNLMTIGYAEVDGIPVRVLPEGDKNPQINRTVKYTERVRKDG